jgi:hypothetical protein
MREEKVYIFGRHQNYMAGVYKFYSWAWWCVANHINVCGVGRRASASLGPKERFRPDLLTNENN